MPIRPFPLATRTLVLLFVLSVVAVFHARAAGQSTSQDQQADGPPSGSAQGSGPSGRRPGPPSPAMELDRITKVMAAASVPLSDAQKVAILGILEDHETAQQSLQGSTTDRAALMQQVQALDKASRTAILAVLTEAQQKIFASLRKGPPSPPNGTPPGNGGTPPSPPSESSDQADSNIDSNTGGGVQQSLR